MLHEILMSKQQHVENLNDIFFIVVEKTMNLIKIYCYFISNYDGFFYFWNLDEIKKEGKKGRKTKQNKNKNNKNERKKGRKNVHKNEGSFLSNLSQFNS